MSERLWSPTSERIAQSNLCGYLKWLEEERAVRFEDYWEFHRWSVERCEEFWSSYARYSGLDPKSRPCDVMSEAPMPRTTWFSQTRFNYAERVLFPPGLENAEQAAVIACDELGGERELSYGELRAEVARCRRALQKEGIGVGDHVAAYACNVPETLIFFLAAASLGAIFSSCSPDFGYRAAWSRFSQLEPRVLLLSEEYSYGGRKFERQTTARRLLEGLESVSCVVAIAEEGSGGARIGRPWKEWMGEAPESGLEFEAQDFDHPLYVLFSSGTTGRPKAMVHRAGGAWIKHHTEHYLHCDIRPGDRVFYFTTCGWMMWNWLVSALSQAATLVLYEGSPVYPEGESLWKLAEKYEVSFFGTSAPFLAAQRNAGVRPRDRFDLTGLRTVASTGAPLSADHFRYVYAAVKDDLHLASISGGTDIVGCFMLGVPTLPVHAGEIQAPGAGVDLAALDAEGEPVVGEPGELVCRNPLPSMPLRFVGDDDFSRYQETYFSKYPGVWCHGDLIELTEQRGIVVYGRSDATLNPGGVRMGTSEIYEPLEELSEIREACAVAKRSGADEEIWLFLVTESGAELDGELEEQVRRTLRSQASPRHVPRRILQVPSLPRTRSGKLMEKAVRQVVNGVEVSNRDVAANPEAFDEIERAVGRQKGGTE